MVWGAAGFDWGPQTVHAWAAGGPSGQEEGDSIMGMCLGSSLRGLKERWVGVEEKGRGDGEGRCFRLALTDELKRR